MSRYISGKFSYHFMLEAVAKDHFTNAGSVHPCGIIGYYHECLAGFQQGVIQDATKTGDPKPEESSFCPYTEAQTWRRTSC